MRQVGVCSLFSLWNFGGLLVTKVMVVWYVEFDTTYKKKVPASTALMHVRDCVWARFLIGYRAWGLKIHIHQDICHSFNSLNEKIPLRLKSL